MEDISIEQKAHDLAVAYAAYSISNCDNKVDIESFYQECENAYAVLLPLVKRNA